MNTLSCPICGDPVHDDADRWTCDKPSCITAEQVARRITGAPAQMFSPKLCNSLRKGISSLFSAGPEIAKQYRDGRLSGGKF